MARVRFPSLYALALLAGALLVAIGGWHHPVLTGDGPAQLATIAAARDWREIHLHIVFGFPLVVTGLIGVLARHIHTPGAAAARAGMFVSVFGYAIALVGVLFMTGAAPALARAYTDAGYGLAGTHAVFAYDMLHPFALIALRVGAFAVSIAALAFGWALATGGVFPRWLGWAAVAAGVVGAIAAVALSELVAPQGMLAGLALATVWQVVVGGLMAVQEVRGVTVAGAQR